MLFFFIFNKVWFLLQAPLPPAPWAQPGAVEVHRRELETLTVDASIDPPNHTAYLCMWWVMTWTSIGLGWKGGRTQGGGRGGGVRLAAKRRQEHCSATNTFLKNRLQRPPGHVTSGGGDQKFQTSCCTDWERFHSCAVSLAAAAAEVTIKQVSVWLLCLYWNILINI